MRLTNQGDGGEAGDNADNEPTNAEILVMALEKMICEGRVATY